MALFVFLATATRTWVVTTNLWTDLYWLLFYRSRGFKIVVFVSSIILTGGFYLRFVAAQFTHIRFWFCRRFLYLYGRLWLLLLYWYFSMTKEVHNIFINCTIHLSEQGKGFLFINNQWIFLLVIGGLNTLFQIVHSTQ